MHLSGMGVGGRREKEIMICELIANSVHLYIIILPTVKMDCGLRSNAEIIGITLVRL